jgi:hypothetical protein
LQILSASTRSRQRLRRSDAPPCFPLQLPFRCFFKLTLRRRAFAVTKRNETAVADLVREHAANVSFPTPITSKTSQRPSLRRHCDAAAREARQPLLILSANTRPKQRHLRSLAPPHSTRPCMTVQLRGYACHLIHIKEQHFHNNFVVP